MYGHIGEGTGVFQTKTEWIDAELRRMLAAGELEAGERLPLGRLAARFGTSEIPVREALRMLHRDGLVDLESHRGATVASITWEQIRESISIRTHLELLALREAAPRHTPATLRDAREALEEMEALAGSEPRSAAESFSEANRRFHERLYEPCDSPLLKEILDRLWDRMWGAAPSGSSTSSASTCVVCRRSIGVSSTPSSATTRTPSRRSRCAIGRATWKPGHG